MPRQFHHVFTLINFRLGSVAGPVIQATGMSEFEDGLGSGDFVSGYSSAYNADQIPKPTA
jgi:hypothetical protein